MVQTDHSYVFTEGDILLVPRNQLCAVIKRPTNGNPYKSIAVTFRPERLTDYYAQKKITIQQPSVQKLRTFARNALLDSYFSSILSYFEMKSELPDEIALLKIQEGISILRSIDKEVDSLLADFSEPGKINLAEFMEKNFMFNMPLQKFSYLTGRSVATFNRDFRKIFHTTPQRWLTQKRLELSHYRLAENKEKPAEVYLEAGFENLSHFSFAFKKHFGYAPTELRKEA